MTNFFTDFYFLPTYFFTDFFLPIRYSTVYFVFKRSLSICHIIQDIFSRCSLIWHSISKTANIFWNILDSTYWLQSTKKKMYTRNFCLFAYFQSCNNKIKFLFLQTVQPSGNMSYLHKSFCTKCWYRILVLTFLYTLKKSCGKIM